jgi:hypothetical protein
MPNQQHKPNLKTIMSNLSERQLKAVTVCGGTYFASNWLSWSLGKTPWEAMGSLDLNYEGKIPKVGTKNYEKWTDNVSLYYIPDAEKWAGVYRYIPVDGDNIPIGILLYSNDSEDEHNQKIVHRHLTEGADAVLDDPHNLPIRY